MNLNHKRIKYIYLSVLENCVNIQVKEMTVNHNCINRQINRLTVNHNCISRQINILMVLQKSKSK